MSDTGFLQTLDRERFEMIGGKFGRSVLGNVDCLLLEDELDSDIGVENANHLVARFRHDGRRERSVRLGHDAELLQVLGVSEAEIAATVG